MLNVTLSGLRAFQKALDTTSHNIANASTPGYSRQTVQLATTLPVGPVGVQTGSGVSVAGVSRSSDALMSAQMRRASSGYSSLTAYQSKASELNNLFANSSTGLTAALQKFTNAAQGVATTPSSLSSRQLLLSEADGLVTRLQSYQSRLDEIDTDINEQLRAQASSINAIAQNISRLNNDIARSYGAGQQPNDLMDARDAQLADLASRVDTSVVSQDDGSISVFIGKGQPLVVGGVASQVVTQQDPFIAGRVTLAFKTTNGVTDISGSLSGGTVGGLMDVRREMLDPARNELGRVAVALGEVTNQQHAAGMDLYGNLGEDFFQVGGVQVIAASTNTSNASLSATRTGAGELTTSDYMLRFDGGAWQAQRIDTGQTVAITAGPGGTLQFDGLEVTVGGTPASGERFMVRPTAQAIDGMKVVVTDPSRVAAAAPIRSTVAAANAGSGTITAGEVLDADNAALRTSVTIRFTSPGNWQAVDASNAVVGSGAYTAGANIDVNGWRVQIGGAPAVGDSFTVANNAGGVGDNRNALKLSALMGQGVLNGGTESLDSAASRLVGTIGVSTNGVNATLEAQKIVYDDSVAAVEGLSGVNLDEEAANLIRYQQAYQAAAQLIRVTQDMMDTLFSVVRR
ncbi:MAG: flagellar hook-associated protein FlgK [Steroidobacteraceae bacterium]